MGMMDDLQKRLEKFGKDVERSVTGKKKPKGGHTLGGAADSALEHAFDASRPLGMTLTKADDGRAWPHVVAVVAVPSRQKWPAGQGWSARAVPVTSQTYPAGHNLGTGRPRSGH